MIIYTFSYRLGDIDGMLVGSFFYGNPIYDIEGSSQAKGVEVSSSKDWSSCVYDSYV
jgi:hypothetical protein